MNTKFKGNSRKIRNFAVKYFANKKTVGTYCGTIGFISCILLLSSMILLRLYKKLAMRLVMYNLTADLIIATAFLSRYSVFNKPAEAGFWCTFNGVVSLLGDTASFCWTAILATWVALTVLKRKPSKKFEIICNLFVWPICLICATAGFSVAPPEEWYQPVSGYINCFIADQFSDIRIYFMHVWVGIVLLYIMIIYFGISIYAYVGTRKAMSTNRKYEQKKKKTVFILAVYPIIYFTFWFWIIVGRILQAAGHKVPVAFLQFGTGVLPYVGFVNSLWMGISRNIFSKIILFWKTGKIRKTYEETDSPPKQKNTEENTAGRRNDAE